MQDNPENLSQGVARRAFLKTAALSVAAFYIVPRHVLGKGFVAPSDMLNFGFIGTGKQSAGLRDQFLRSGEVQIVAAADVDRTKVARFVEATNAFYQNKKGTTQYKTCLPHTDFKWMLLDKSIDAVVIASPDHWHATMGVMAANAGKDIYLEKPLTLTVVEGRKLVTAVRKNNRVLQTGSMQRSSKEFRQAVELVTNGYIGDLKTIKVNVGGPPKDFDLAEEPMRQDLNWQSWLGPNVVWRPYNGKLAPDFEEMKKFWPAWRNYKDFGGGGMTDWGAHMFDIAQWGMGMDDSGPVEVVPPADNTQTGLLYRYANGVEMLHNDENSAGIYKKQYCHFIGTKGDVWVARGELKTSPETLKDVVIKDTEKRAYQSDNHYGDFINAIRSRQKPICDVEIGHRTASVCNIGNIAYDLKRPLKWNPATELFEGDAAANAKLSRPMKKEFSI